MIVNSVHENIYFIKRSKSRLHTSKKKSMMDVGLTNALCLHFCHLTPSLLSITTFISVQEIFLEFQVMFICNMLQGYKL
jgi:hypothetical protein